MTYKNIKISVLMSVYNGATYLETAIESILGQTFKNFEFIIVDDGSFDSTPEILRKYEKKDTRIKIITQENKGLSPALNKALSLSSGEFAARQDPDDKSDLLRFEKQIEFFRNNPDVAVLGTNYHIINEKDELIGKTEIHLSDEEIRKNLIKANCFGHGSVMIRKNALINAGGYDESFRFAQDYDLWLRLSEHHKLANIEEPLYYWRQSNDGVSIQNKCEQEEYARIAVQNALIRRNKKRAKNENPVVSVIVPTYNRPEMLENTIQSILGQTYQDFEIIVVNDAGINVAAIIEKLEDDRIVYLTHEKNRGLSASRNTGIKEAKGKFLCYLDDDDIFYPQHLSMLVNTLEKGNRKVVLSQAYRSIQAITPEGKYRIFLKEKPYSALFDKDLILVENIAPINSIMHAKECIQKTGFFDEELEVFEDWDFQLRLSRTYDFSEISEYTSETRARLDNSNMTFSNWQNFFEAKKLYIKNTEAMCRIARK